MPAPKKPAVQSGPGALSQRTDGGPASKQAVRYAAGIENAGDFVDLQSSAAMEKAPPVRTNTSTLAGIAAASVQGPNVVPLDAPTRNPNQPITSGADAGTGPGSESLGLNTSTTVQDQAFKQQLASYMPALMHIASMPDTSPETRNVIRQLRETM